ncbi:MAG: PilZ domain-containing protein, partial [Acidobacteria bacterium]|nr:PilZ domain-containing protein [Acidobacteriota bacterium]
ERQAELRPRSFFEQYVLSEFLAHSPRALFAEAGLELLTIASGDNPLAVDPDGRIHVIAAQKGGRRPDLAEGLEQASHVANLSPNDILARAVLVERGELTSFLREPLSRLNRAQGVVLIAESFDESALRTILWLQGRYGLHVACVQVSLLVDARGSREFVSARVASLDTLSDTPERWIVAGADTDDSETAADHPPADHRDQPEWRRDFAAVFDEQEPDVHLATFPSVDVPLPAEEPSADALETLFDDEPESADEVPYDEADGERRGNPRSPEFHARRLRLDYQGRLLGARLVDFSDQGLGVEVLSQLPVGSEVAVSGEISGEDGVFSITGKVIVEHCRSRQDGVYRIGFSLEKAVIEKLSSPPEDFDRR